MKWTKKKRHELVELFLKQPLFLGKKKDKVPVMNYLRGNPNSKILCVAPPPSIEEYERNIPLSDNSAKVFHNILAREGISTERDMLVVSASRFGERPSKASCSPVFDFVLQAVKRDHFDLFVCIGEVAFRHIFAYGRKPNIQTLVGNIVYLNDLNHAPLFTFPSLDGLVIPEESRGSTWRWHKKSIERMTKIAGEFSKVVKLFVK
jgi:uracil-DNA glycosylase